MKLSFMRNKYSLPTIEKNGYHLANGIELNKESPKTFWIPTYKQKRGLKKGNIVKLIFHIKTSGENLPEEATAERMWVIIVDKKGDVFKGLLDNKPYTHNHFLKPGDTVYFKSEHIVDIDESPIKPGTKEFKQYQKRLRKAV